MYFFIEAKFRKMRKSVSELSDSYVNNYGRATFNEVGLSTPHGWGIAFAELKKNPCVVHIVSKFGK